MCTPGRRHLGASVAELAAVSPPLGSRERQPPLWLAEGARGLTRGDGTTASDLDVLVIRPDGMAADDEWADQLSDAGERLWRATGNQVAWINLSRADLRRVVKAKEPIVDEWRRDAVHLHGAELRRLLRAAG